MVSLSTCVKFVDLSWIWQPARRLVGTPTALFPFYCHTTALYSNIFPLSTPQGLIFPDDLLQVELSVVLHSPPLDMYAPWSPLSPVTIYPTHYSPPLAALPPTLSAAPPHPTDLPRSFPLLTHTPFYPPLSYPLAAWK